MQVAVEERGGVKYLAGVRVYCSIPGDCSTTPGAPTPAAPVVLPPPPPPPLVLPSPPALLPSNGLPVGVWSDWLGPKKGPAVYGSICPCGTYVTVNEGGCWGGRVGEAGAQV